MSIRLRSYQEQCIEYFHEAWAAGHVRVPAVLSTGAGKTVIFTHPKFLSPTLDAGKKVLIIAHTDELIEQAAKKARAANPKRRVGIVKAALNQTMADIIVSSRQTIGHPTGGPRRLADLRNVGLIIIDEAHHAIRTNTYGKILEHFGAFIDERQGLSGRASAVRVAGFTATLARGDKAKLSSVWETPVIDGVGKIFRRDILFFIRRGFLLDVRGQRVIVPDMDMRNVKQVAGDYRDTDIADELERTFAPEIVAKRYADVAADRKGIAFWPLVETAEHGARAFNEQGIRSEVIHGNLAKPERRALLARLHSGETQVVHGVGVLTEGFDEPTCDVVVIARPTRSAPLYQQMVGRVLRPDLTIPPEQREKALILDVVGAGAKHDLRSLVDLSPEIAAAADAGADFDDEDGLLMMEGELEEWLQEEEKRVGHRPEFAEDYHGETKIISFDPLGRTNLWQRTPGGTYFMTAGSVGYVFLVDSASGDPGTCDVVLCSKNRVRTRDGIEPWAKLTEHIALPLDLALAEAEELALDVGGHGSKELASKKSKWRNEEPTAGQKNRARGMGVWRDGMTKGECSQAIDLAAATGRIDPMVAWIKAYDNDAAE